MSRLHPSLPACGFVSLALAHTLALALSLLAAPPAARPAGLPPSELLPSRRSVPGPLFESVPPSRSGLDLVHRFPPGAPLVFLQEQGAGAGIAAGDFDGDGLPDLLVSDYDRGCRLYRNLGDWRFLDVTDTAGIRSPGRWCMGVAFADIDGDGRLDLHVCRFNAPNLLFINRGDGTFAERARDFGLAWTGASVMATFTDYDLDGRLDVFLLTHRDGAHPRQGLPANTRDAVDRGILRRSASGSPAAGGRVRPEVTPEFRDLFSLADKGGGRLELAIAGQADQLFRQGTNGVFDNVTEASGIRGHDLGLGAAWWDYDGDGLPDLHVANDHQTPDRLWHNLGHGRFVDVAPSLLPSIPLASMGTDTADADNDGWIDLLATEMAGSTHERRMVVHLDLDKLDALRTSGRSQPPQIPRNHLYLGTGGPHVREAARLAGIDATDWTWSPKFGDFDNDGWVDLFVANGMSHDYVHEDLLARLARPNASGWREQPRLIERNLAFRNRGALRFEPVAGAWGLDLPTASFGACVADFDRDGNLDLAVMNLGEPLGLFRNNEAASRRVVLRLVGNPGNTSAVGTVLRAETSHGTLTRCLQLASGFLSANEPIVHFGLGQDERIRRLSVRWPGGTEQSWNDLPADRRYTLTEPPPTIPPNNLAPPDQPLPSPRPAPWFQRHDLGVEFTQRERAFDDFGREPLLPWQLSRLGPGLAVGDIDGDGDDDFHVGGVAGQPGSLGVHEADGAFRRVVLPAFELDRESADMGALFFDADGDGDLDLFVVSGGVPSSPDSPALQDRLYLNDGRGMFNNAPQGTLPRDRDSGTAVCAADFDHDGDLDLFVGARSSPGQYLAPARSRLLLNEKGRFLDATDTRAPGLASAGMVTGAAWFDADDDGWLDLVTSREWGPLVLHLNHAGRLESRSGQSSGFGAHSGWWQSLAVADLDGDGHLDLVASNHGLNGPYPASPERPMALWRGEFQPGAPNQLIQGFLDGTAWRPIRRRERLAASLPVVAARAPSFSTYSHATLPDLFPETDWPRLPRAEVTSLATGVWHNEGGGRFTFQPLPRPAQIAPAFGVVAADLDADGHPDIALLGNFDGYPSEFGPATGGLGLLLRGRADGNFPPLPPAESGFRLTEEFRALALLSLNREPEPDLLAVRADGRVVALANRNPANRAWLAVHLRGHAGNPTAIGARVGLGEPGKPSRVAEVAAGGGYLSQSSATLFLANPDPGRTGRLSVRWPDATRSSHQVPPWTRRLEIEHPALGNH